jgi:L,D-transpeptidase catalytic domain
MTISWVGTLRRGFVVAIAAAAVGVLAPAAAVPAQKDLVATWVAPTPAEGSVIGVAAKTQVSVSLAANSVVPNIAVRIRSAALPPGAVLHKHDGNAARATFVWTPAKAHIGDHRVTFTASSDLPGDQAQRTIVIRVGAASKPPPGPPGSRPGVYPKRVLLSDRAKETYRWAFVRTRTVARTGPSKSARRITRITYRTPENYRNAIQVLDSVKYRNGKTWVRIRLAVLPNGRTGWVPRGSLAGFQKIHTRLTISHGTMRATLYTRGRRIFSTRVGVGQPRYPTPRGEYYVREKLQGYYAPAYGPRAFGLNARSAVLTDWPGGGFIGIHGTNQPHLIPGRISHGCVRVNNAAVMRLFRLVPIGTPVSIS